MSNPTIVTKLTTLVRGIFGRKDPVVTTVQDPKDETPATEGAEQTERAEAPAEVTAETVSEVKPSADSADTADTAETTNTAETTETADAAHKAEDEPAGTPEAPEGDQPAEAPKETAAEGAPLVEEPRDEPSVPATADVPEDGTALAEEIEVAEAHTTVASDDVLERVRKEAAPAAEDLAVPTYDELTLPSIRARLRKLTIEQVRDLRAYEVAHQGRPEFIKMYDNRIAKLESEA
ncbi:hypothetical protein [Nocardiopsis sp. NPDC006938]|uniref:hypothetical protein n=1 Tax=Nocardiopsis sp. NPDC006938 TaxID=3364337 RepID=UPI0036B1FBC9